MDVPDPEEDFDGFMDSLPLKARDKILAHMRGDSDQTDADRLGAQIREIEESMPCDPQRDAESARAYLEAHEKIVSILLDQGGDNALD